MDLLNHLPLIKGHLGRIVLRKRQSLPPCHQQPYLAVKERRNSTKDSPKPSNTSVPSTVWLYCLMHSKERAVPTLTFSATANNKGSMRETAGMVDLILGKE